MSKIGASTKWGRIEIDAPDEMPLRDRAAALRDLAAGDEAAMLARLMHAFREGRLMVRNENSKEQ